jgi:hypothetical protein
MSRRDHPILEALGATVLIVALVASAPGALGTFAFEHALRLRLDVGQRWTFAVSSSVLLACGFAWRSRTGWDGAGRYFVVSFATAAAVLVMRFGFRAAWAAEFFTAYLP